MDIFTAVEGNRELTPFLHLESSADRISKDRSWMKADNLDLIDVNIVGDLLNCQSARGLGKAIVRHATSRKEIMDGEGRDVEYDLDIHIKIRSAISR